MEPSLSMNQAPEVLGLEGLAARTRLYAAQRASQPLTFFPADGSAPLRAWALKEAGDGHWDIIVDNTSAEIGTPHRIFETRARLAGPLDHGRAGLFTLETTLTTPLLDAGHARLADTQKAGILIPTPEEARRAQEAARRAHAIAEQAAGGWGGTAEDLHRGAREEAQRQIAMEQRGEATAEGRRLANAVLGSASGMAQQSRAPGKMFSRSDILAIIRAEKARGRTPFTNEQTIQENARAATCDGLISIFENLE